MKILVGYDGSDSSKKAIEKAKDLTSACEIYEIMIVHVHEDARMKGTPYYDAIDLDELGRARDEIFEKEMEDLKELSKGFEISNIKTKLLKGDPAKEIADYAKEEGYDLIIVGSRGAGGIMKWMPGSVSSAIVKNCCVSVMVVK